MKRWRIAVACGWAGLVPLVFVSGCGHGETEAKGKESATPRVVAVTVAPVTKRNVERTIDVVGSLRGWEQLKLGTKRAGRVVKVLHDMGDHVKPGEPLIVLDPIDAQLALKQAEAKYLAELVRLGITAEQADNFVKTYGLGEGLLKAKVTEDAIEKVPSVIQIRVTRERAVQNLARQRALASRSASTQQELDDAENTLREAVANYENAKYVARNLVANAITSRVALDQARLVLSEMTIHAPVPALVPPGPHHEAPIVYGIAKRAVSEGETLKEGDTVAELVIEDPLRLWASVPERFGGGVRTGQKVRVTVPSHPAETFEGRVSRINPTVDTASRTFQVEAILPNDKQLLRPGGFAKASIVTEQNALATVVPIESIGQFAGVTKLFVVKDGKAHSVTDIATGVEGRGWIEVASKQIADGDRVVTTGQTQLAEGTSVVIRTPEPANASGKPAHAAPEAAKAPEEGKSVKP